MLGIFGKKNPPSKMAPKTFDDLYFKENNGAFEYACKYFNCKIKEKQALCAIILDSSAQDNVVNLMLSTMNKGENVYTAYALNIASDDGGFKGIGLCYKKQAVLKPDDLVFWVPMNRNPTFAMIATDKRASWIGGIVAKLAPSYSVKTGGFEIVERFT